MWRFLNEMFHEKVRRATRKLYAGCELYALIKTKEQLNSTEEILLK
jgi:hypothetical protein